MQEILSACTTKQNPNCEQYIRNQRHALAAASDFCCAQASLDPLKLTLVVSSDNANIPLATSVLCHLPVKIILVIL